MNRLRKIFQMPKLAAFLTGIPIGIPLLKKIQKNSAILWLFRQKSLKNSNEFFVSAYPIDTVIRNFEKNS